MSRKFAVTAIVSAATIASALVIFLGSNEEPYFVFRPSQALIQVGVGSALMLLWVEWIGVVVWQVTHRALSPVWLSSVVWALVVMFYLSYSPIGYVQDLSGFSMCP
jgi:hypothetical protein